MSSRTERTTIVIDRCILKAAKEKARDNEENLSDFISRAILNQLEKEDIFNVRYEMRNENADF